MATNITHICSVDIEMFDGYDAIGRVPYGLSGRERRALVGGSGFLASVERALNAWRYSRGGSRSVGEAIGVSTSKCSSQAGPPDPQQRGRAPVRCSLNVARSLHVELRTPCNVYTAAHSSHTF